MATVSVPEKTIEHWASIYVTYRFRSKASLWWPTQGEDIDVRALPGLPGKAVQLEVKTCVPGARGSQDIFVDLGQLWDYQHMTCPPFYVFPWPNWSGNLEPAAVAAGLPVTELAYSRSGIGTWWCASWLRVLTTDQVAKVLSAELAAHGGSKRGNKKRLVRIHPTNGAPAEWGTPAHPAAPPTMTRWRTFWDELTACGRSGWPQLLRLPQSLLGPEPTYNLVDLRRRLAELGQNDGEGDGRRYDLTQRSFDDLVTLTPNREGNGLFVITPDPEGEVGSARISSDIEGDDHRQVTFLDARAIAL